MTGTAASPSSPATDTAAPPNRWVPVWAMTLGVVLYSTGPVLIRASDLSGPAFSFWRLWLAVPVMVIFAAVVVRRQGVRWVAMPLRLPLVGGVALAGNQLLVMTALKLTSVADVTIIGTLAPVMTGIAAWLFLRERLGWRFWSWTALSMAGAVLVVAGGGTGPEGGLAGHLLALASVVGFVAFILTAKDSREHVHPVIFTLGATVVATVVVSAFVALVPTDVAITRTRDLLFVLGVVLGGGTLGHVVFTWALRWLSPSLGAVVRLSQPILAGGLAWAFLGEPFTVVHALGGSATIVGVAGAALVAGRPATEASPVSPAT